MSKKILVVLIGVVVLFAVLGAVNGVLVAYVGVDSVERRES